MSTSQTRRTHPGPPRAPSGPSCPREGACTEPARDAGTCVRSEAARSSRQPVHPEPTGAAHGGGRGRPRLRSCGLIGSSPREAAGAPLRAERPHGSEVLKRPHVSAGRAQRASDLWQRKKPPGGLAGTCSGSAMKAQGRSLLDTGLGQVL